MTTNTAFASVVVVFVNVAATAVAVAAAVLAAATSGTFSAASAATAFVIHDNCSYDNGNYDCACRHHCLSTCCCYGVLSVDYYLPFSGHADPASRRR